MRIRGLITLFMLCSMALQVSAKPTSEVIHRGAQFSVDAVVSLDKVLSAPNDFADKQVRVSGTVKKVCLKKGCWLVLAGKRSKHKSPSDFQRLRIFCADGLCGLVCIRRRSCESQDFKRSGTGSPRL